MTNAPAADGGFSPDTSPGLSSVSSTVPSASPPASPQRASTSNDGAMNTKPAAATTKSTPSPPRKTTAPPLASSPLRLAPSSPLPPIGHTKAFHAKSSPSPTKPPAAAAGSTNKQFHNLRTPQMLVLGRDGSDYRDFNRAAHHVIKVNHPGKTDKQVSLLTNIMSADDEHLLPAAATTTTASMYHLHHERNDSSSSNNDIQQPKKSSWWRGLWGTPKETTVEPRVAALDLVENNRSSIGVLQNVFPQPQKLLSNFHISMGSFDSSGGVMAVDANAKSNNNRMATIYYQDGNDDDNDTEQGRFIIQHRQTPPRQALHGHASLMAARTTSTTAEDQLQSECSFFYRPVEDEPAAAAAHGSPRHPRGVLRSVVASPNLGVATRYRDAEDVLAPPEIAQYQAKYQQLNQDDGRRFRRSSKDRDDTYSYDPIPPGQNDLFLDEQQEGEEGGERMNAHSLVTNTVSQSTLFYRDHGRVVLRLPRDHVRLIMDPHLEPGILSVVQCRRPGEPPLKQLEYCLTVPTDLYLSVVSEMTHYSDFITTSGGGGGGGLDSSFYASDHLDIRVAVGVISFTLLILGILCAVFHLN